MKIGVEQTISDRGHDIVEASFKIICETDVSNIIRDKEIPEDQRQAFLEDAKHLSMRRVEDDVLRRVFEHINEQSGERRNPSYMGFCIYETVLVEQGKPVLIMHPADMGEYLKKGVVQFRV